MIGQEARCPGADHGRGSTRRSRASTRSPSSPPTRSSTVWRTRQVQAVIIDYPVVQGWLKDKANADAFKVVDNLNTGEQYGFTVKKGNTKLLAEINKTIKQAKADGTYKKLYEKWIGPYPASVTASPSAS